MDRLPLKELQDTNLVEAAKHAISIYNGFSEEIKFCLLGECHRYFVNMITLSRKSKPGIGRKLTNLDYNSLSQSEMLLSSHSQYCRGDSSKCSWNTFCTYSNVLLGWCQSCHMLAVVLPGSRVLNHFVCAGSANNVIWQIPWNLLCLAQNQLQWKHQLKIEKIEALCYKLWMMHVNMVVQPMPV
jgi:hypothetical protein